MDSAGRNMSQVDREEREHFRKVLSAFRAYKRDTKERLHRTKSFVKHLPPDQQRLLQEAGFQDNLDALENCAQVNYSLILEITADVANMFENKSDDGGENLDRAVDVDGADRMPIRRTDLNDMDKVQSTLKQFVRDWSKEGEAERSQCYDPILRELEHLFADVERRCEVKVLVPGAGLGRLAFEIAKRGFECQGNEFSLFMLIASNFVLNKCSSRNCFKVYPYIHQHTNVMAGADMIRGVSFPDVNPNELTGYARFSMAAGDFLEVYGEPEYEGSQDCVATCFFLDCAHNVVDFISTIRRVLKPGGYWINFGPLLYHFADMPTEFSIEPSYDMVRTLVTQSGFEFLREETGVEAVYSQNKLSMLQTVYKCVSFTCQKKS